MRMTARSLTPVSYTHLRAHETCVADINGRLWTSLFLSNRQKLLDEIDRFSEKLQVLRDAIEREDSEGMEDFLNEAGRRRRELMHEDSEG